jgi:hypothetical protein
MVVYEPWGMATFHGVNFRKLVPAGSAEAYAFAIFCVAVAAAQVISLLAYLITCLILVWAD